MVDTQYALLETQSVLRQRLRTGDGSGGTPVGRAQIQVLDGFSWICQQISLERTVDDGHAHNGLQVITHDREGLVEKSHIETFLIKCQSRGDRCGYRCRRSIRLRPF